MEFSLFKNLDKAFDNLERTVADTVQQAALSVVDEFPERSQALQQKKLAITGTSASASKTVAQAWEELSFEERKVEWQHLKEYLEKQPEDGVQWQQRAKLAESKLLQLCTLLVNCPDPLPDLLITASVSSKVVDLEEQNRQLRQAADSAYKDDAEVKGLLSRFQSLEEAHRQLQEETAAKDAELAGWRASASEMEAAHMQQKEQLNELMSIKSALKTLRVEYEKAQSQLFEFASQREQEATKTHTDVDVLLEQLERASAEVRELQRERDGLVAQLQNKSAEPHTPTITATPITDDASAGGSSARSSARSVSQGREAYWEVQVQLRDKQIERLQADLEAAKASSQESLIHAEAKLSDLHSQLEALSAELDAVNQELEQRPSQDDVKELQQRAQALQAMVDVQVESEGWDSEAIAELLRGSAGPTAVQTIVQERNRKLSAELTTLRQHLEAKESDLQQASSSISGLQKDLQRHQELVKKLEDDLQAAMSGEPKSALSTPKSSQPSPSPRVSLPVAPADPASQLSSVTAVPMVDIVARQRDRFRQRVGELEEELRRVKEELTKAKARIDAVSADNVSLYEKVRYLERYSNQRQAPSIPGRVDDAGVSLDMLESARSSSRYQCGPFMVEVPSMESTQAVAAGLRSRSRRMCLGGTIEAPSGVRDVEQQYARAYEAQLNPFKAFREGESEQRIKNLGFGDRAVLTGGKLLAGSKLARIFVAVYTALLHGFIMLLLYYSASPCTSRYSAVVAIPPSAIHQALEQNSITGSTLFTNSSTNHSH